MSNPQKYPIDDTLQPYYKLNQWYAGGKVEMVVRGKIYISNNITPILFRHAMAHQKQQELIGYAKFKFLYVLWWGIMILRGKRGYEDNPFEKEADECQRYYRGWERVTKDSWKLYK